MELDVRTPTEKAREKKHREICNQYLAIASQMPHIKPSRIMLIIAQSNNMTVPGVRNIVINNDLYKKK